MRKQTILKIERKLKARAKKMRLGKKRTGAYVFGTLRKLQKNPVIKSFQEKVSSIISKSGVPENYVKVFHWYGNNYVVHIMWRKFWSEEKREWVADKKEEANAEKLKRDLEAFAKFTGITEFDCGDCVCPGTGHCPCMAKRAKPVRVFRGIIDEQNFGHSEVV